MTSMHELQIGLGRYFLDNHAIDTMLYPSFSEDDVKSWIVYDWLVSPMQFAL